MLFLARGEVGLSICVCFDGCEDLIFIVEFFTVGLQGISRCLAVEARA